MTVRVLVFVTYRSYYPFLKFATYTPHRLSQKDGSILLSELLTLMAVDDVPILQLGYCSSALSWALLAVFVAL